MQQYNYETSAVQVSDEMKTPKIIHFVYLIEGERLPVLSLRDFLAIRSAIDVNKGYEVRFHSNVRFEGSFWSALAESVTFCHIDKETVEGLSYIDRIEHKTDVLRLKIINEYGGIYLDLDTVCVKSFDDLLSEVPVMGMEGDYGLCNAVIISPPKSAFVEKWLSIYDSFHNNQWNYFSVQAPKNLYDEDNTIVRVMPEQSFFLPSFNQKGLEDIFLRKVDTQDNYIIHLWGKLSKKYTDNLTVDHILNKKNTYNDLTRRYVEKYIEKSNTQVFSYKKSEKITNDIKEGKNSFKGLGNSFVNNIDLVSFISVFVKNNNIGSIVEFSINQPFQYNFMHWNKVTHVNYGDGTVSEVSMPDADLLIVNHSLQHFSNDHIIFFRDKILPKYRHCIITNSCETQGYDQNVDIVDGEFRPVDLLSAPFSFPGSYVLSMFCKWEVLRTILISR